MTTATTSFASAREPGGSKEPRSTTALLSFAACFVVLFILRYSFMRANGFAFDEPVHIQAGYRYWQCGEFANNPEHPPLVKFLASAPIRHWQINAFPSACGTKVIPSRSDVEAAIAASIFHSPNASQILWKARSILICFPLLLLVSLFFAVRGWFGNLEAAIAALLVTIEPTMVAHGSLVTTDMAVTATMFLTIVLGIEYVRRPRWWLAGCCGVALGMALTSKHSAVLVPIFLLITMWLALLLRNSFRQAWFRTTLAWLAACIIGIGLLWSSYGFRYNALPNETTPAYDLQKGFEHYHMQNRISAQLVLFANRHHWLPEAYSAGLADIMERSERPTYFFGRFYEKGFWYYFPVALAIKLTLGVLLLAIAALLIPSTWRKQRANLIPCIFPPFAYLAVAMMGKMDIGVRHVLPVIPFLIVIASVGAAECIQRSRRSALLVGAILAGSAFSALRAAPLQLSYANEAFGGSNHTYRLLGDSNVDWGNTSGQLSAYLSAHHLRGADCAVARGPLFREPSGCMELPDILDDFSAASLPPPIPDSFKGTLILQPFAASWSSAYIPLMLRKPVAGTAQGTILVYEGEFDLKQVAALRHLTRGMRLMSSDPAAARQELWQAAQNCAESECAWAHEVLSSMTK
ncbi:MAG TPA: glycosyltransferase family 39 protein [Terriglobales bacterium]|nr:glycosyltransferase family 39 protein [Terriglobales bacterium]